MRRKRNGEEKKKKRIEFIKSEIVVQPPSVFWVVSYRSNEVLYWRSTSHENKGFRPEFGFLVIWTGLEQQPHEIPCLIVYYFPHEELTVFMSTLHYTNTWSSKAPPFFPLILAFFSSFMTNFPYFFSSSFLWLNLIVFLARLYQFPPRSNCPTWISRGAPLGRLMGLRGLWEESLRGLGVKVNESRDGAKVVRSAVEAVLSRGPV